jgi:hypothetical protein
LCPKPRPKIFFFDWILDSIVVVLVAVVVLMIVLGSTVQSMNPNMRGGGFLVFSRANEKKGMGAEKRGILLFRFLTSNETEIISIKKIENQT